MAGPFLPLILQPFMGGDYGLRGLFIGLLLWLLAVLITGFIHGTHLSKRVKEPYKQWLLVLLTIMIALICSFSFGFAACSAIGSR